VITRCKHDIEKLCKACSELKPYMIYVPDVGYLWGPGQQEKLRGKRPWWSTTQHQITASVDQEQEKKEA